MKKSTQKNRKTRLALLGYSQETMDAANALGYEFVAVVLHGFEDGVRKDGVEAVGWDFSRHNDHSGELFEKLTELGCSLAIPLYEETVEWAGALNARFLDSPRLFNRTLLLRDKAMMKRKAQMSGLRVGFFEEVASHADVHRFYQRVNDADGALDDELAMVHIKPLRAAGSVGHRKIRSELDISGIPLDAFPLLAETHLAGQEFSVEAFIHDGKIRFMNINEYVRLGHCQITPAGPELEARRPQIRAAVEKLILAFDIRYGVIHPEYFVDDDGELAFGEVANRVPGGNIFELIEEAFGFNPYQAVLLTSDRKTTEEELASFFPSDSAKKKQYAGNLLVFPKKAKVESLKPMPEELLADPYYRKHSLLEPLPHKVVDHVGFGTHYGVIYFNGLSAQTMREKLTHYGTLDYYS